MNLILEGQQTLIIIEIPLFHYWAVGLGRISYKPLTFETYLKNKTEGKKEGKKEGSNKEENAMTLWYTTNT